MNTPRNPSHVHPPVGRYVHQIEVTNPSRILFISGQVGIEQARRNELSQHLGEHVTCSTFVYVAGLASPDYKVEIDAWAAA